MDRSAEEIKEIERHKYFLSEKRGHDVGWEFAEQDWELHHAARWRREQLITNSSASSVHTASPPAADSCCSAHSAPADNGCQTPSIQHPASHATSRRGPLLRLLSRLFPSGSAVHAE